MHCVNFTVKVLCKQEANCIFKACREISDLLRVPNTSRWHQMSVFLDKTLDVIKPNKLQRWRHFLNFSFFLSTTIPVPLSCYPPYTRHLQDHLESGLWKLASIPCNIAKWINFAHSAYFNLGIHTLTTLGVMLNQSICQQAKKAYPHFSKYPVLVAIPSGPTVIQNL